MHSNQDQVRSAAWLNRDGDWVPVECHADYRTYNENFADGLIRFYFYGMEMGIEVGGFLKPTLAQVRAILAMAERNRDYARHFAASFHDDGWSAYGLEHSEFEQRLRERV